METTPSTPLTPDINHLARLNAHPRDKRITFDPIPHTYTIDGDPSVKYTSVTTWNHSHFEEFDADAIIGSMMRSKKWTESKYYGKSADEIKAGWDTNRDEAAAAGTAMHYDIECYYNQCPRENTSTEYEYFKQFLEDYPHLEPYRTEWTIFHEELRLSGSIDMVFRNKKDGTFSIYDWKRCREIKKTDRKCSTNPIIEHIPDTNYWHYCLQLNTYKAILESKYDLKIYDMYLVCLHPENKNKSYKRIMVINMESDIKKLFDQRRRLLKEKGD
jgi:ATP-dependent exoDNAse (exonuclease V) beta subunit